MRSVARTLGMLVAALLLVTMVPAGAAPPRTAKAEYRGPSEIEAGPIVIFTGAIVVGEDRVTGPAHFKTRRGDRFVSLKIVDDSGEPIQGHVEQTFRGRDKLLGHFCGSTDRPLRIAFPGRRMSVYPGNAPCGSSAAGATQGVVIARFSR